MLRTRLILIFFFFVFATHSFSDGLLISSDTKYPKDFLRNRLTRVTVNIHGIAAETSVYQEFVNEWTDSTDAVYSFPLPSDARATEFLYWVNNKIYRAVLKKREQAANPGTGEGGIIALVNEYIGRNGIKVVLKGIAPRTIQSVQLRYISLCDYYCGKCTYRFPLDTGDFVKHPIDHLQFNFNVKTNSDITEYDIPTHPNYQILQSGLNMLNIEYIKPKAYINSNLEFWYKTDNTQIGIDFYSVYNDTGDGHFVLFIRPPDQVEPDSIFTKRVIFLLNNSSRMFGYKLSQSISAISQSLDLLSSTDFFNIIIFNNAVTSWQNALVSANGENIQKAKDFLSTITSSWGSSMDLGIKAALNQIPDDNHSNAILVFTDGRSSIDPREIDSMNVYKTGIFPIGIGDDLDRARLEMTAALNYGFVTYFNEDANLSEGMLKIFKQISQPILKNVAFEYGRADLYDILPQKIPTTYAGSYFFTTGRYQNSGQSALAIAGKSVSGFTAYNFSLDFSDRTDTLKFAESVWAKEMIDAIEQEIEIYGETEDLKNRLIALSLRYNIRCRYTAYITDDTDDGKDITQLENRKNQILLPSSFFIGNYPNPFNPTTTIKFYLSANSSKEKINLIKIFNSLGQIVFIIDTGHLKSGTHTFQFNGQDFWGNPLPSGLYFVVLQVGAEIHAMRITLLK